MQTEADQDRARGRERNREIHRHKEKLQEVAGREAERQAWVRRAKRGWGAALEVGDLRPKVRPTLQANTF